MQAAAENVFKALSDPTRRAIFERDRREGRETHYRAQPQALAPLIDWMSVYGAFWRDRFDRLENLLKRMDK